MARKKDMYCFQVRTEYPTRFISQKILAHNKKEMWEFYNKHHNLKVVEDKYISSCIKTNRMDEPRFVNRTFPCYVDMSFYPINLNKI